MIVYSVLRFSHCELCDYKLFRNKEDAEKLAETENLKLEEDCKNNECCFCRVQEVEVN